MSYIHGMILSGLEAKESSGESIGHSDSLGENMISNDPFIAGHLFSKYLLFLSFHFCLSFYFFCVVACIKKFVLSSLELIMMVKGNFKQIFLAVLFTNCKLNFGFNKLLDCDLLLWKFWLDIYLLNQALLLLILNLFLIRFLYFFLVSKINCCLEYLSFLFKNQLKKVFNFFFLKNFKKNENANF